MKKVRTVVAKRNRQISQPQLTIGFDLGDRSSGTAFWMKGRAARGNEGEHHGEGPARGFPRNAAQSDRAGDGDTFTLGKPVAERTGHWRPIDRLRLTADYHQHNLINDFTPFYNLYGNVSYHNHSEGVRLDYELPANLNAELYYRHRGITRSNAALCPQVYSFDNTDLLRVVPSSTSNTTGLALRYHDSGHWSARADYEWTGTHDPGYPFLKAITAHLPMSP